MEYKSVSTLSVQGRKVIVVKNDIERKEGCPDLIGKTVVIDGKEVVISGIENLTNVTVPVGARIGLQIQE